MTPSSRHCELCLLSSVELTLRQRYVLDRHHYVAVSRIHAAPFFQLLAHGADTPADLPFAGHILHVRHGGLFLWTFSPWVSGHSLSF